MPDEQFNQNQIDLSVDVLAAQRRYEIIDETSIEHRSLLWHCSMAIQDYCRPI